MASLPCCRPASASSHRTTSRWIASCGAGLPTTGDAAGTSHLTWTDRPFVVCEATAIELAGAFGRYHAPLARTVMLGDPLQHAFKAVIAAHRLTKESRIGYSIGIGYPTDWGERTVSLRAGETTELAAGMARR